MGSSPREGGLSVHARSESRESTEPQCSTLELSPRDLLARLLLSQSAPRLWTVSNGRCTWRAASSVYRLHVCFEGLRQHQDRRHLRHPVPAAWNAQWSESPGLLLRGQHSPYRSANDGVPLQHLHRSPQAHVQASPPMSSEVSPCRQFGGLLATRLGPVPSPHFVARRIEPDHPSRGIHKPHTVEYDRHDRFTYTVRSFIHSVWGESQDGFAARTRRGTGWSG